MKVIYASSVDIVMEFVVDDAKYLLDILSVSGSPEDIKLARQNYESAVRRRESLKDIIFDAQRLWLTEEEIA